MALRVTNPAKIKAKIAEGRIQAKKGSKTNARCSWLENWRWCHLFHKNLKIYDNAFVVAYKLANKFTCHSAQIIKKASPVKSDKKI